MRSDALLRLADSHHVLYFFETDWGRITPPQRDTLLQLLEETYPRFADWMSCFVATELLGEHFADGAALAVVERLVDRSPDRARSLLAHALEHLAVEHRDDDLGARALACLAGLASDPSPDVRREAAQAIVTVEQRRLRLRGM